MARRLVQLGIIKDHTTLGFGNRAADEGCTARITGTDLIFGDDVSALLHACANTRDGKIWTIDHGMHHDNGEAFTPRVVDQFKLGGMREDGPSYKISTLS